MSDPDTMPGSQEIRSRPGALIPPPELTPAIPSDATPAQCIAAWFDLVEATDRILIGALRSRSATEAEAQAAYREVHERASEEHTRAFIHMANELGRRLRLGR